MSDVECFSIEISVLSILGCFVLPPFGLFKEVVETTTVSSSVISSICPFSNQSHLRTTDDSVIVAV